MRPLAFLVIISLTNCHGYSIANANATTDLLEYVLLDKKHPCSRTCTVGGQPMVCRYKFTIEWYHTLSKACYSCPYNQTDCFRPHCIPGDGKKRSIVVVNRQMPGPAIEVCQGDEIIADVENALMADTTTIHWHGFHQHGTPYMDGVPYVTQCPIQPGSTFRYHFRATNAGTHFWHSHTGMQRADGAYGAFIVRVPEEKDPHCDLYDYDLTEHVMVISDWAHENGIEKFTAHHHNDGINKPETLLINGLGQFEAFPTKTNKSIYIPSARFVVEQGYRYRMRIINAEFLNCPIEVSVDNHTLTVISGDGNDFQATKAESVVTYAGERFDFILNADQPKGLYWIRFKGLMDCDERFTSAHQSAVLQYVGMSSEEYPEGEISYKLSHKEGIQINALNEGTESNRSIALPNLVHLGEVDDTLKEIPDFVYFVSYDFYRMDNPHFHNPYLYAFNDSKKPKQLLTPQLNRISLKLQPFPLLSERHLIQPSMLCDESTVKNCDKQYCECTHVVHVPLNQVIEMVLIDKGYAFDANHPFHLHGHAFHVVAMERLGTNVTVEKVEKLYNQGRIKKNLVSPPLKDTVTVPDGGYTIIRFKALNPGYWLFHCHIEFHAEVGMAFVFKFGEDSEMPPVPNNFPQCGNYVPIEDIPHQSVIHLPQWLQNLFSSSSSASSSNRLGKLNFVLFIFVFVVSTMHFLHS